MCSSHSNSLSAHALFTHSRPVVQHPYLMVEFAYSLTAALSNGATRKLWTNICCTIYRQMDIIRRFVTRILHIRWIRCRLHDGLTAEPMSCVIGYVGCFQNTQLPEGKLVGFAKAFSCKTFCSCCRVISHLSGEKCNFSCLDWHFISFTS